MCWDTCEAQLDMAWDMLPVLTWDYRDMLTLIGQGAQWIGRAPLGVTSVCELPWFPGVAGSRLLRLWVLQRPSILQCLWKLAKQVWLRKLLAGLFGQMLDPTVIHCDNQSYVKLSENLVSHDRSKHVEIKFHYIRDMVQRKAILMQYLPTNEQIADVLTKPLAKSKF